MFENIFQDRDVDERIERVIKERQKHEYRKIGSEKRHLGHIMYSYNLKTGEIKIANIKECKTVDFWTRKAIDFPKVIVERDCIYRQALNKKNLIKILKREGIIDHGQKH